MDDNLLAPGPNETFSFSSPRRTPSFGMDCRFEFQSFLLSSFTLTYRKTHRVFSVSMSEGGRIPT